MGGRRRPLFVEVGKVWAFPSSMRCQNKWMGKRGKEREQKRTRMGREVPLPAQKKKTNKTEREEKIGGRKTTEGKQKDAWENMSDNQGEKLNLWVFLPFFLFGGIRFQSVDI